MKLSRREFTIRAIFGLLALLVAGFLVPGIRLFSPTGLRTKEVVYVPLMPEEDLPRSGVKKAELVYQVAGKERKARVFVVSGTGDPFVLSAVCSHLGCLVNYHRDQRAFVCPCHGGKYDLTGNNIAGPPPAPLSRYPVVIREGMLLVGVKV